MKTIGMPAGMWALFAGSFQRKLTDVLGYDRKTAARVTRAAHRQYRKLIEGLPDFEKGDRFRINIVSCAMLAAFVLNMPRRPRVDELTAFYTAAMMTEPMKWFCRQAGKRKFSPEDIKGMKETAAFRAADRNPYSWNMEFLPYPDGCGYEARFSKCGICTLMRELGLGDLIPAVFHFLFPVVFIVKADIIFITCCFDPFNIAFQHAEISFIAVIAVCPVNILSDRNIQRFRNPLLQADQRKGIHKRRFAGVIRTKQDLAVKPAFADKELNMLQTCRIVRPDIFRSSDTDHCPSAGRISL